MKQKILNFRIRYLGWFNKHEGVTVLILLGIFVFLGVVGNFLAGYGFKRLGTAFFLYSGILGMGWLLSGMPTFVKGALDVLLRKRYIQKNGHLPYDPVI
jgi:hypothetical protein